MGIKDKSGKVRAGYWSSIQSTNRDKTGSLHWTTYHKLNKIINSTHYSLACSLYICIIVAIIGSLKQPQKSEIIRLVVWFILF